jgi:acyl-CoA synthetase (NDP forming)/RimJ/RimL family protein N-acetyltransferase
MAAGYAETWEADVVTSDGRTAHIRPIRPDDGELIRAFHERQSAESTYFRFFSPRPVLPPAEIERMTHVDYRDRMAFVVVLGDDIVGVARYDRWRGRDDADVAVFVDDDHNGRGLATLLLEYLAAAARANGLSGFTAQVLPANQRMLGVLRQAGFEVSSHFADGIVEVKVGLTPTEATRAAVQERDRRSQARSVARLLAPETVAVIGAGRDASTVGRGLLRNVLTHGYTGAVYAVNRDGAAVEGVPAWCSVADLPVAVDVAIIAVPAAEVPHVVADCAAAHVGGLVVVSAGFGEGTEGRAAERSLVATARRHGMRLLGPGSMGVINTDPDVGLHAALTAVTPPAGRVGLGSQAGSLSSAILERARALELGISTFVSLGNRADVSGNDLLHYWEEDERTDVVLLHLDSFGNPRTFGRVARRLSRRKPIVAVRGRPSPVLDALLRQTGLLRVDTLEEMLDVARVLAGQPLPAGNGVAVVANSQDAAALASDALSAAGLAVLAESDLTWAAGAAAYGRAARAVLAADEVDAVLVVYAPPVPGGATEVAEALADAVAAAGAGKTVVAACADAGPTFGGVPNFTFPDAAARVLGAVAGYAAWRRGPEGEVPEFAGGDFDVERARAIAWEALAADALGGSGRRGGPVALRPEQVERLLQACGIHVVDQRIADGADAVVDAARELGGTVAIKATGRERLAKTEAGGLALDVHGPDEARAAYTRMRERLGDAMVPALVQRMVNPGVDVRVGALADLAIGAAVSFGRGGAGTDTEPVTPDRVRLAPLTDIDSRTLIDQSDVAAELGEAEHAALEDLLLRVGRLVDLVPEVRALYLNPVIVSDRVACVVDARATISRWTRQTAPAVRRIVSDE